MTCSFFYVVFDKNKPYKPKKRRFEWYLIPISHLLVKRKTLHKLCTQNCICC